MIAAEKSGEFLVFRLRAGEWFEAVPADSSVDWKAGTIAAGSVAGALLIGLAAVGIVALWNGKRRKRLTAVEATPTERGEPTSECADATQDAEEDSDAPEDIDPKE